MTEDSLDLLIQDWTSLPQEGMSLSFALREDVNLGAEILLLGEALGEEEAEQGRAFVGKAGKRLNDVLRQAGLDRPEVSIANIIPRRPLAPTGENRTPTKEEIKANSPFVKRLVVLHPHLRVVVLLGGVPFFWKTGKEKITESRGREFQEDGIWYVPTFHPAYVLRSPSQKVWLDQDMRWAVSLLKGDVLDVQTLNFPFYNTADQMEGLFQTWAASRVSYLDIEAGAEPPVSATWHWDPRVQIVLISLGWVEHGEYRAAVIEVNPETDPLIRLLLDQCVPEYVGGHYCLLYDVPLLRAKGFTIRPTRGILDSFLLAKLNDENRGLSVKDLAKQHLSAINHTPYRTEGEEKKWQGDWIRWPVLTPEERGERIRYSGADSLLGIQVLEKEVEQAKKFPKFRKLYWDLLVLGTDAIIEMEQTGLRVDTEKAIRLGETIKSSWDEERSRAIALLPPEAWRNVLKPKVKKKKIKDPETKEVTVLAEEVLQSNGDINLGSPQQVGKILFSVLGLASTKKSEISGNDSTDEESLLSIQGTTRDPVALDFIERLLNCRGLGKAHGTYIQPVLDYAGMTHDGLLHPRFSMFPVSWRLNSEKPNAQNFPGAKSLLNMRQMIVPPEGCSFVSADFSALEVRGIADASGDPLLCELLNKNEDMHLYNAIIFFNLSDDTVRDKTNRNLELLRQTTKTLLFATAYGAWEFRIADTIRKEFRRANITARDVLGFLLLRGVDPQDEDPCLVLAREWRGWLKSTYRGIVRWWGEVERKISESGIFVTKFGFHRNLPDIFSDDKKIRADAVRQAINIGPQNLSIMTQVAANELRRIRDRVDSRIRLWQNGHDALEWLCPEELAEGWAEVVKAVMEDTSIYENFGVRFRVPVVAEVSISKEWG